MAPYLFNKLIINGIGLSLNLFVLCFRNSNFLCFLRVMLSQLCCKLQVVPRTRFFPMVRSSTYFPTWWSLLLKASLIMQRKVRGPVIVPCGTPPLKPIQSDKTFSYFTLCFLFVRKSTTDWKKILYLLIISIYFISFQFYCLSQFIW